MSKSVKNKKSPKSLLFLLYGSSRMPPKNFTDTFFIIRSKKKFQKKGNEKKKCTKKLKLPLEYLFDFWTKKNEPSPPSPNPSVFSQEFPKFSVWP